MATKLFIKRDGSLVYYNPSIHLDADGRINIPQGQCAYRPEEHLVYFNPADIPKGAEITIRNLTTYVYAQLIDENARQAIAAAEKGSTDGISELVLIDESITSIAAAKGRAETMKARGSKIPIEISFSTYIKGWEAGQQLTYRNAQLGINEMLTVFSVIRDLEAGGRSRFDIVAACGPRRKSSADVDSDMFEVQRLSKQIRNGIIGDLPEE